MDFSSAGIEGAAAADDDSAWIHRRISELVVSPQVSRPLRRDGSSPNGCNEKGLLTSAKTISQVRFGGSRLSPDPPKPELLPGWSACGGGLKRVVGVVEA